MTGREERPRGRRRNRGEAASKPVLDQMPWRQPVYQDPPIEPLDEEGVEKIHATAMRILEEIGIDFLNEEAKAVLKKAGADVDPNGDRVRMDRDFVMDRVRRAPAQITITPRNPDRSIVWGGRHTTFGNVSSPPNVTDLDHGRRTGTREDFRTLLKLSHAFNCIHFVGGYPVEPIDIHPSVRHLDAILDKLVLTDKVIHAYCLGTERVEDAMEMVRIAAGLTHEEFDARPRMFTNINSSSPLKHDWPMLDGAMRMARRGQPVLVTPFTLSGAMAPVTLAGAIAQQTAEALAAIALLQEINPGVPVGYGAFTSNVDMKTGAPAFGTPEFMRATQMSGQMARFYRLPFRSTGANAANFPDGQAVWESMNSLFGATTAHANVIYHAAGWLEGGLLASMEKFVMDCEVLQQIAYYHQPVVVDDATLAFDAIAEVGPHGHFFGVAHTMERYRTAYYAPFLSDWSNFETWMEAGGRTVHERANTLWKKIVAAYEAPPMDQAIREELEAFVARRKEEGGAPTDF
ncbi:trimethylamine methyltransferase family protein [Rhodobium gokarnense]|uniref:Methyltransferase n=1 Tax=Rhodobium gokarnense TaxID=364296 RepID=A0ABT3H854_9HYPH|nr:trimethylamine methyltransferase family protein [Rhodobium gokarnense]MCW2306496.1 trimethylamine--corrinoid protein Co-methyltransferase [Rhodobium gokarnense]